MLPFLQPNLPGVVNAASEFTFIMGLFKGIQNELCVSHRFLAEVWLGSPVGVEWMSRFKKASVKRRETILPHEAEIESGLDLSTKHIALLWTSIVHTVHPSYWNPLQWGPNSQVDDTLFLRMKAASYRMIALFLKASGVANMNSAASWNLSNDTKTLILLNGSDSNNRTAWPRLPEMPSKSIQWMKMHPFYWSYTNNEDYEGFYVAMCELGNLPQEEDVSVEELQAIIDNQGEHREDTKIAAYIMEQHDSIWEATTSGLILGRMGPLAHGLYAIESLHQSNARARSVITCEHRKIATNNELIADIEKEMEEAAMTRAIYADLKAKYENSGKELFGVRQKNELEKGPQTTITMSPQGRTKPSTHPGLRTPSRAAPTSTYSTPTRKMSNSQKPNYVAKQGAATTPINRPPGVKQLLTSTAATAPASLGFELVDDETIASMLDK
jgi:hypothetical protein